jgi:hypothetical protein
MMMWDRLRRVWLVAGIGLACGPQIGLDDDERSSDSDGAATSSASSMVTSLDSTTTDESTTSAGTISTSSSSSGDPDNTFLPPPDDVPPQFECDMWTGMPCQRGEKCMPWDNAGSRSWNGTRCSPIAPDPAGPGEPCSVEDSPVSGIDDCEAFSMCWNVDPQTNQGTCVPFCKGSEASPTCDDPCSRCMLTGSGVLILCLPTCDPLAQDCPAGQACFGWGDGFFCAAGPLDAAPGEPCDYLNQCEAGSFCASAASVPGCRDAAGCCTPFCDVTTAGSCPDAGPGVECVSWFEEGQAPPGDCFDLENIGACLLPQ